MLDSLTHVQKSQTKEDTTPCTCSALFKGAVMDHSTPEIQAASGEKLLTASELEAWLEIDRKTVYTYVQRGLIPYIKIQSNVRFRRSEIADWLETHSYRPNRGPRKKQ